MFVFLQILIQKYSKSVFVKKTDIVKKMALRHVFLQAEYQKKGLKRREKIKKL